MSIVWPLGVSLGDGNWGEEEWRVTREASGTATDPREPGSLSSYLLLKEHVRLCFFAMAASGILHAGC